jgi:hypothetical protein
MPVINGTGQSEDCRGRPRISFSVGRLLAGRADAGRCAPMCSTLSGPVKRPETKYGILDLTIQLS